MFRRKYHKNFEPKTFVQCFPILIDFPGLISGSFDVPFLFESKTSSSDCFRTLNIDFTASSNVQLLFSTPSESAGETDSDAILYSEINFLKFSSYGKNSMMEFQSRKFPPRLFSASSLLTYKNVQECNSTTVL